MTGAILWSEKTKYLATCSRDGWIKVFKFIYPYTNELILP